MSTQAENEGDKPPTTNSVVKLKKNLGLFNGIAIIVGVIVGSGIFVSPKGVLLGTGSVWGALIVWTLCGAISLIGAMCYAELGTAILESGGDYAYINRAFGPLPAFLYVWVSLVVVAPTSNAIAGLAFAYYALQPVFPYCDPPDVAVRLLAGLAICMLTFVNCASVRVAALIQNFFSFAKIMALVILILVGLVQIYRGRVENFQAGWEGSTKDPRDFAMAFYAGLYSYAGWNYLNFVTEEIKNPFKNLPRAIWISIPLVTIIYVLANVAYFTVLSPRELLASHAVAVSFADKTMGVLALVMPLFVAASTFGGLNGNIFSSSRISFVAARNGHMPDVLSLINMKYLTPLPSLILMGVLSLIMLSSTNVYTLINYTAFVEAGFQAFTVAGLLYLRYTIPEMKRPIKVSLVFPVLFFLVSLFLLILPLFNSPLECLAGIGMTLTGIPVYLLAVSWKSKPKSFSHFVKGMTSLSQKLLYATPEDKEL